MKPIREETQPTAEMKPVQQTERMQILDILRGFAVFGILVVNIVGFATPAFWPGYAPTPLSPLDSLVSTLVKGLAEAKFYSIFSFLFGLGFSVQIARSAARGKDIRSFYPRRLWALFGLGLLHAVLLWTGDILRIYALLGFALLAFRNRSNRTLLIAAGVLFALSFASLSVFNGQSGSDTGGIPGVDFLSMARSAYTGSSFADVIRFQVFGSAVTFVFLALTQGPSVMALFLLGLLAGRLQIFERLPQHRQTLRLLLAGGLCLGLAGNLLMLFSHVSWQKSLGLTVGAPALAAAYIAALCLLFLQPAGGKLLRPIGQVGRMALSNYVLQSLVCSLLFYGFGLGWYEQVGAAGLLGIALLIYLAQIPFSALWLSAFQFGPLEWLWRSLTYRKRQPLLRPRAGAQLPARVPNPIP